MCARTCAHTNDFCAHVVFTETLTSVWLSSISDVYSEFNFCMIVACRWCLQ